MQVLIAPALTRVFLYALLIGLVLVTGLARVAGSTWPFELLTHFQAQCAALALLLLVVFQLRNEKIPAAVAAALLMIQAAPVAGRWLTADASTVCRGPPLRIATVNLYFRNDQYEPLLNWLASQSADVVVLQELTPQWAAALTALDGYPHRKLLARTDPYGIAIISRWPLLEVQEADLAEDGLPSLFGRVVVGGSALNVLAMHTHTPLTPGLARARDAALARGARRISTMPGPAIAAGDLNLTSFSPVFGQFLEAAGLRDVFAGLGWRPTWQAGFWPLALRIDHILVSPELCVSNATVGPAFGSDHRPVVAQLHLARD